MFWCKEGWTSQKEQLTCYEKTKQVNHWLRLEKATLSSKNIIRDVGYSKSAFRWQMR
jgi:hypothetical protein